MDRDEMLSQEQLNRVFDEMTKIANAGDKRSDQVRAGAAAMNMDVSKFWRMCLQVRRLWTRSGV